MDRYAKIRPKKLGKGLGEMHLKSAECNPKMFGFPVKGFIGTTDQKKGWEKNWSDCLFKFKGTTTIINS